MTQSRPAQPFHGSAADPQIGGAIAAGPSSATFPNPSASPLPTEGIGSHPSREIDRPPSNDREPAPGRYDAWLELDADALRHNAKETSRFAEGRPIVAAVKNNGYGLGIINVARILDPLPEVAALAVVKADEAFELLDAGVTTPILLMALAPPDVEEELAARGVRLAAFDDDAPDRLKRIAARLNYPVPIHIYVDTGMSRMGIPEHRAISWLHRLAQIGAADVEGTFMTFTETDDFELEQVRRFRSFVEEARARRLPLGKLHAVSSRGLFFRREFLLDAVRTGLILYGAYPAGARELGRADLRPAFRLRARVVRVERLRPGDGVNYWRKYVADRPVWVATVPVGYTDGYHRQALNGCEALIGGRTYRVIGAVSASHTMLELGEDTSVSVGDVVTVVGSDDPAIHPNEVAKRAGISVYDVLMRLGVKLPRVVWNA